MIDIITFIGSSLLTTVCTISVLFVLYVLLLYLVGVIVLTFTSIKYKLKNPLMWFNPTKLIEYSGVKTTIYMGSGDLIIDYFGHFPRVKFIKEE